MQILTRTGNYKLKKKNVRTGNMYILRKIG